LRRKGLVAMLLPALLLLFIFGWVLYVTRERKQSTKDLVFRRELSVETMIQERKT
jgi:hypothetical protein